MKKTNIFLIVALAAGMASCGQMGYKKTPSGVEYKIHVEGKGPKVKVGEYLEVNMKNFMGDTMVLSTYDMLPQIFQIQKPQGKYDFMEAMALLGPGDSATFLVPADSVFGELNRPPFLKKGQKIRLVVKAVKVLKSLNEANAEFTAMQNTYNTAQTVKDNKVIEDYLAKNHLKGIKSPQGVYIVIKQDGNGAIPQTGQLVKVNYTGKTLEGQVFDSNVDSAFRHVAPLEFPLGQGQVIRGWDEGIAQLKKGTKASLIIPSPMAYGLMGQPPVIKPNTILVFDVELLDVRNNPTPASKPGMSMPSASPKGQ